ncbi:Uncharacterised protein [Achromobacter xylosoxidans]|nr:Uncharacterised protein [Achromobacter xylosoxidans]
MRLAQVGGRQRLADRFGIGGAGAVDGVGQHQHALHRTGVIAVQVLAGLGLVHVVDLLQAGLGGGHVVAPDVARQHALHLRAHFLHETRVDETGVVGQQHRRRVLAFAHGAHEQHGVRGVAGEDRHVRLGGGQLLHFGRHRGRAGAVGDVGHHLALVLLGELLDRLVGVDAKVGVLVDHRDLGGRRALHAVQELHHVLDEGVVVGRGAEEPLVAALGQVRAAGLAIQVGNAALLGDAAGGLGDGRLVGAGQGHHFLLVDQALRVGQAHFGLALRIAEHHFDLGPAQRRQAGARGQRDPFEFGMRVIDDVHGQFHRGLDLGAGGRQRAGQGIDRADLHGLDLRLRRRGGQQRQTRGDTRNELHLHYLTPGKNSTVKAMQSTGRAAPGPADPGLRRPRPAGMPAGAGPETSVAFSPCPFMDLSGGKTKAADTP